MSELPAAVRAFLDEHIFSASQLEVLLLLHARAGRPLTLGAVARETRLPASAVEPWLQSFAARGLVVAGPEGYAFAPPGRDAEVVQQVAETYRRRRTTLSRYLYSRGQDPLTRFADAFRLRRDPPGPDEES